MRANMKGDKEKKFAVLNWAAYSNSKATLFNTGQEEYIFKGTCKPFTQEVIYQMMGVYIINGLSPSPKLEKKIQP